MAALQAVDGDENAAPHLPAVRAARDVALQRKLHDAVAAAAVSVGGRAARAAVVVGLLDQRLHHVHVVHGVLLQQKQQ